MMTCHLFCYLAVLGAMFGLTEICPLVQNLLWEKNVRNQDGDCMEVIRLKVRCTLFTLTLCFRGYSIIPYLVLNRSTGFSTNNMVRFHFSVFALLESSFGSRRTERD